MPKNSLVKHHSAEEELKQCTNTNNYKKVTQTLNIFTATFVYGVLVSLLSILLVWWNAEKTILLVLPFSLAMLGYSITALVRNRTETSQKCLFTLMCVSALLLVGCSGETATLILGTLLEPQEYSASTRNVFFSIIFILSLFHLIIMLLSRGHLKRH